jgi:hypothetical protein
VSYIDNDVIKVVIQRLFVHNMRYDEDESIKGDVIVVPRGAVNLAVKETTNQRRVEFLTATANPIDAQIMGVEGRAAVLREIAKELKMPWEEVVPSKEKMEMKAKLGMTNQQAEEGGAPTPGQPTPTDPAGAPKGGMNTVSNQFTGRA